MQQPGKTPPQLLLDIRTAAATTYLRTPRQYDLLIFLFWATLYMHSDVSRFRLWHVRLWQCTVGPEHWPACGGGSTVNA